MKSIPLFYFPTTILLVDDDEFVLNILHNGLNPNFKTVKARNVNDAINLVEQYKSNFDASDFIIKDNNDDIHSQNTSALVKFDFSKIMDISNHANRFSELSVVISDYEMPGLTGLDLCKHIRYEPIKKILLTGIVDESKAIEAFNLGVIDRYIKKNNKDVIQVLNSFIEDIVLEYFIDLSKNVHLISSRLAILSDDKFINLFNQIIKDDEIREFYLIDQNGSFLLIDKNGKKSVLIVTSETDLDEFTEFYSDAPGIQTELSQIKNRNVIPFFGIGVNPSSIPLADWNNVFFKANELQGLNTKYYWSICSCS